ncbi:lipocalin-like domain-containing protein [Chryseobacterium pennipullorum]|nr:lipocalin family protein [Chryseobacterium pennipullorum]
MKRTIFILLVSVLFLSITECTRDDYSDKPAQERILGKWKLVSIVTEVIRPSAPVETSTEYGPEGNYFDFRNDGNVYYSMDGNEEQSESYRIENEDTLKISTEPYFIKELTANKLVFESVKVSPTRTRKQTYNFSR